MLSRKTRTTGIETKELRRLCVLGEHQVMQAMEEEQRVRKTDKNKTPHGRK